MARTPTGAHHRRQASILHLVKPLGVEQLEALVHEQELRRAAERARESLSGASLRRAGGR